MEDPRERPPRAEHAPQTDVVPAATQPKSWEDFVARYRDIAKSFVDPLRDIIEKEISEQESVAQDKTKPPELLQEIRKRIRDLKAMSPMFAELESVISERPTRLLASVGEYLVNWQPTFDETAVAAVQAKIDEAPPADRRELQHLEKVLTSEEPITLLIGGHVFIDTALDNCFDKYLVHQVDLHNKLNLTTHKKLTLAHALGMITNQEQSILKQFNRLRNQLAHRTEKPTTPRFMYDAQHEESIWMEFTANAAFAGPWPKYDPSIFPTFTRLMVFALYFRLSQRADQLAQKRLSLMVEDPDPVHTAIFPGLTLLFIKAIHQIKL